MLDFGIIIAQDIKIPTWSSVQLGPVFKSSQGIFLGNQDISNSQTYHEGVIGFGGKLENSFTLDYFSPQTNHKWRYGDTFLAGLWGGGVFSPDLIHGKALFWGEYRFEIGFLAQYHYQAHKFIEFRWKPLIYNKDQISPSISGSSFGINWDWGSGQFGLGILSRQDRVVGFISSIMDPSNHPNNIEGHFQINRDPHHFWGIWTEWNHSSQGNSLNKEPNKVLKNLFAIQLNYGLHF